MVRSFIDVQALLCKKLAFEKTELIPISIATMNLFTIQFSKKIPLDHHMFQRATGPEQLRQRVANSPVQYSISRAVELACS